MDWTCRWVCVLFFQLDICRNCVKRACIIWNGIVKFIWELAIWIRFVVMLCIWNETTPHSHGHQCFSDMTGKCSWTLKFIIYVHSHFVKASVSPEFPLNAFLKATYYNCCHIHFRKLVSSLLSSMATYPSKMNISLHIIAKLNNTYSSMTPIVSFCLSCTLLRSLYVTKLTRKLQKWKLSLDRRNFT